LIGGADIEPDGSAAMVDERSRGGVTIIPLYADELSYILDNGRGALFDRLDEARVNELLDPTRPSVVPAPPPKQGFKWPNLLSRKTRG
jgi:Suppressor of fused protein (SUFU)